MLLLPELRNPYASIFKLFIAFDMLIFFPLPVSEMTSVLNGGGLNYQIGNPVRYEFNKVNALVSDLKKIVEVQVAEMRAKSVEVVELKQKVANLEKMCHDMLATIASMRG